MYKMQVSFPQMLTMKNTKTNNAVATMGSRNLAGANCGAADEESEDL